MGIWAELSRQGSAEASFGLGLLYDLGNGTQEDPATAFFWYKTAAEGGFPAAEFNVAAMYDAGRGVARDMGLAAIWYAKAAARGHHRAQFDLAQLYRSGDGVPQNPDAAAAWLRAAAEGGIMTAVRDLKTLEAAPRPGGGMTAVALVSPVRNVTLTLNAANPQVELVWLAPTEPKPVHFELQVRELGQGGLHTVLAKSLSETAAVVPLPTQTDFYVWNVDTVAQDGSHMPGEWSWFTISAPAVAQQSVASVPGGIQRTP